MFKEIFNSSPKIRTLLLRAVKDSLQKEEDSKMVIRGYINTVVGILSLINDSNSSRYKLYKDYRQDMSLVAKREYAKMKAHASAIEWEKWGEFIAKKESCYDGNNMFINYSNSNLYFNVSTFDIK